MTAATSDIGSTADPAATADLPDVFAVIAPHRIDGALRFPEQR